MAWVTPKTDWAVPDIVQTTDMNNIGNNLIEMRNGIDGSIYGSTISTDASFQIDIIDDYQSFVVNGSYNLGYISIGSNRFIGNQITVLFKAAMTVLNDAGTPASGYGKIISSGNLTVAINDCVDFLLWSAGEWVIKRVS